jgi:transposase
VSENKAVIIGVDPHKLSVTIEVVDDDAKVLGKGRYKTDKAGYAALKRYVSRFGEGVEDRLWAVEGANGTGRSLAQRLLADGERVADVPAKLSARARCSTPATTARPTRSTRTRSRWSPSARQVCDS